MQNNDTVITDETVAWPQVKCQPGMTEFSYLKARCKKPKAAYDYREMEKRAGKTRSALYKATLPTGWKQRTPNFAGMWESIRAASSEAGACVLFQKKANGVGVFITLELDKSAPPTPGKLAYAVTSVQGKQGPWNEAGVDLDLRTSPFRKICDCLLDGCRFELDEALFPEPPRGLYAQAELVCGDTSHFTVTSKIFAFDRLQTPQEKLQVLRSLSLLFFGAGAYEPAESCLESPRVSLLPLQSVRKILACWDGQAYASRTMPPHQTLRAVPTEAFEGELAQGDEQRYARFFADHCQGEGFILKSSAPQPDGSVRYENTKVKSVYRSGVGSLVLPGARGCLLLCFPPFYSDGCMPVGLICAPPESGDPEAAKGREVVSAFFEPLPDEHRKPWQVVYLGGGQWDGIEALMCLFRQLTRERPDRLKPTRSIHTHLGYSTLASDLDGAEVYHEVRTAHCERYKILALDLRSLAAAAPVTLAFQVNQLVPGQKTKDGAQRYIFDTSVFMGVVAVPPLRGFMEDYALLDATDGGLTWADRCRLRNAAPRLDRAQHLWSPSHAAAFVAQNLSRVRPGLPDDFKEIRLCELWQCVGHAHGEVLGKRKGAPRAAALPKHEAFKVAAERCGEDFDLLQALADKNTQEASRAAQLLRESLSRKLAAQENALVDRVFKRYLVGWVSQARIRRQRTLDADEWELNAATEIERQHAARAALQAQLADAAPQAQLADAAPQPQLADAAPQAQLADAAPQAQLAVSKPDEDDIASARPTQEEDDYDYEIGNGTPTLGKRALQLMGIWEGFKRGPYFLLYKKQ